jgi:cell division protein ZapA
MIESKKKELEILKSKFLDLKNLIYEYKNNKEKEIQTLMDLHDNLKKEVQEVNESYSKIIDDTTKEIDDFVDKINADSSVQ